MLKTSRLITVAAVAALALPALAGSWPPIAPRKAPKAAPAVTTPAPAAATRSINGFERASEEPGWQLSQHKYDFRGGRFAMSDECDHAIRAASREPTPAEVDSARRLSPGA